MRFLLRADASPTHGTGHVMRCLTIGEALTARGHVVELAGRVSGIAWLASHLASLGIPVHDAPQDRMPPELIRAAQPDRVVVDSYWIEPTEIAVVDAEVPTLAIIDHDARGIEASWYLDHNLGAEDRAWPEPVKRRLLAGSPFALVRTAMASQRRSCGWKLPSEPSIVAFMGGTDPFRRMRDVAAIIARELPQLDFTAITTADQLDDVRAAIRGMQRGRALAPTPDLPQLLGRADVIVSAAGTSAWDVLTMGRPTVLVGVVENQRPSLAMAIERGLTLGLDAYAGDVRALGPMLSELLGDERLRERLVTTANAAYDGEGARRVAAIIEKDPAR